MLFINILVLSERPVHQSLLFWSSFLDKLRIILFPKHWLLSQSYGKLWERSESCRNDLSIMGKNISLASDWTSNLLSSLGWRYPLPKSPLAIKNCSWRVKSPEEQILAIKKNCENKIADHEFHFVFGHFTLPSLQINSLQTLSPGATDHIYFRYTINTCVHSSFDTTVIMYHKQLWLRFNTNYISKSGY